MNRLFAWIVTSLLLAQFATIVGSWMYSAMIPDTIFDRSLLSSEGIRWMFLHSSDSMLQAPLLWGILGMIALGLFKESGLFVCLRSLLGCHHLSYRERTALLLTSVVLVIIAGIILSLTVMPHALLLSTTGTLIPGPFSHSIITMTCFCIMIMSLVYGLASGTFNDMPTFGKAICSSMDTRLIVVCILLSLLIKTWMYLLAIP